MPGHGGGWRLLEVGCRGWWRLPMAAGQGLATRTFSTIPAGNRTAGEAPGQPQPQAWSIPLGTGDWGWDKAGLGSGPAGGVHVPHQQRMWTVMGIAAHHLQQSSGWGQAGDLQLKRRSQAKAVSKCVQMLEPY